MSIPDSCLQLWWTTWKLSHQAEQSLALGKLDPVLRGMETWEERVLASTLITTKYTINVNLTLKIKRETIGSMPLLWHPPVSAKSPSQGEVHKYKTLKHMQGRKSFLCSFPSLCSVEAKRFPREA